MRRIVALGAAFLLVASLASATAAAGPPSRVNHFVGTFDLVDWDMHTPVAHVVADIREATDARVVPGTLDIYWADGSPFWTWETSAWFTDGRVPRESHAQLFKAQFATGTIPTGQTETVVWLSGYICNYWGPPPSDWGVFDAACQPFMVALENLDDPYTPHRMGFSKPATPWVCCDGPWYPSTSGSFVLTFVRPTYE